MGKGKWFAMPLKSKKVVDLNPRQLWPFYEESACSSHGCVDFLLVPWFPATVKKLHELENVNYLLTGGSQPTQSNASSEDG